MQRACFQQIHSTAKNHIGVDGQRKAKLAQSTTFLWDKQYTSKSKSNIQIYWIIISNNTSSCWPAKYNIHEIVQSDIHPSLPNPERCTYTLQASYTNRIRNIYRSMLLNATPVNGVMGSEGLCYSPDRRGRRFQRFQKLIIHMGL